MTAATLVRFCRRIVRRFARDNRGNIAVTFAIALLPILAFVGAGVDYSRANAAKSSMQAALDSTALMLSRDLAQGTITSADIGTKASAYFKALYTSADAKSVAVTANYTASSSSSASNIQLTASGQIITQFMKLAGFPTMDFSTKATTTWGDVKMRVALALDNTGSMASSNKMTALQNAVAGSGGLIDQLSALAKTPGDVYISVIPFAKVVNVGANNYAQDWIDWTDWQNPPTIQPNNGSYQAAIPNGSYTQAQWDMVGPGSSCPFRSSNGFSYFSCASEPTTGSSSASRIPSSGTYNGYICPGYDSASHSYYNGCWTSVQTSTRVNWCTGSNCSCQTSGSNIPNNTCSCTGSYSSTVCKVNTFTHTWVANAKSTWTGCVADRTQPNDANAVSPATSDVTTLFPANQHMENSTQYCSSSASTKLAQIVPLSYNWSSLKSAVNAMEPTGGTNQAIGMAWAVQSLIPNGVLGAPAEDANTTYNRVIILLSDGLNTEDRWPEYGNGSSQASGNPIDARQALLCSNLKNSKDAKGNSMYTIYTIQVNTSSPADATSTVLQNCASSPDKFYMLTSSSQIVATFNSIGTALSKLRVAK
ncbi:MULTISPECIES: pilus assembly protein [unclassified Bradyrhizobium]|uniref:TadE/TadG family type IV pilus assembly protein n=1 Tax=unclassified Bradyrhizobium TaxID=2631580 RepID=UPI0028E548FD|nr:MULTISPECIES: pilus assembly protein [unclassified Bradyrhizobium]